MRDHSQTHQYMFPRIGTRLCQNHSNQFLCAIEYCNRACLYQYMLRCLLQVVGSYIIAGLYCLGGALVAAMYGSGIR